MSFVALSSEIAKEIGSKIPVFFKLFRVLFPEFVVKPGFLEEFYPIHDLWNRTFYKYIVYQLHVLSQFAQFFRFSKTQYQKSFNLKIVFKKCYLFPPVFSGEWMNYICKFE